MIRKIPILALIFLGLVFSSLNVFHSDQDLSLRRTFVFKDNFENGLKQFWKTNEFVDTSRYGIVNDPLNPNNSVLRINLNLEDTIANGLRSEIKIKKSIDSFGYKNTLSFRFMLPESFYAKENNNGRVVLQQWHNRPYPGFDWRSTPKVRPPEALYFDYTKEGDWTLVLQTGLFVENMDEVKYGKIDTIPPNIWHTFKLESFWSLYSDGYFKASINDQCFEYDNKEQCLIQGKNMYHTNPSYFKMGLYRSGGQQNNRSIFFDDFKMTAIRDKYFP